MQPEFEDETPINPFDFWSGANFKLKVRKVAGFVNYDKSEFDSASELFEGNDDQKETVWKTQYALTEFTNTSNFKSYDELKQKLYSVVGEDIRDTSSTETRAEDTTIDNSESNSDESGDALSYFEKLANE